jgi:DNA-binding transcriptional LysR family regulator
MGTVDLNDLGVFVAVVEAASFSLAAQRLGIPKSSVSRAIVRLEDAVSVAILHRTTRRVAPSTAGQRLYERVRAQVASLRESAGELPDLEEALSGRLRVTTAADFDPQLLSQVIGRFVDRHPAIEVELHLTNEFVDLVAGGFDLALRFATRRLRDSTLTARKLAESQLELFAAPSYLERRGTPRAPRDLASHDWVVFHNARRFRLVGPGRSVEVAPRGRIHCNNMMFVRAAIVAGYGIGGLTPHAVESERSAGKLIRVLPQWSSPISEMWAVWPGRRKAPRKVAVFLEILLEVLRSMDKTLVTGQARRR